MKNYKASHINLLVPLAAIAAFGLLASTAGRADAPLPLVLTGYNADVIVDATGNKPTGPGINPQNMDTGGHTYYDAGFATTYSSTAANYAAVLSGAFPAGGAVTGSSGNVYDLAPDTGNEDLLATGTLTLAAPLNVTTLYVLGTASGAPLDEYTLTFAGGATATGSFTLPEWYNPSASGEVNGLSRADVGNPSTFETGTAGGFHLYVESIDVPVADQGLALESFTLTSADGGTSNIFALDAEKTIPEPSTWAMFGLGAALLLLKWRKRAVELCSK